MVRYWNNKGKVLFSTEFLTFCSFFLGLCFIFFWILYPDKASSGPYLDSAHGNTSNGVNRSTIAAFGYSVGNCTHCHEQHASIGGEKPSVPGACGTVAAQYELFCIYSPDPYAQNFFFCEACHMNSSPIQTLTSEYNYSYIAGGNLSGITCPSSIRDAFGFITDTCSGGSSTCGSSSGSAHCLRDIVTFLATMAPSSWNFKAGIDPCSGCHNPHRAQVDYDLNGFQWASNSKSSLSLPSRHSTDNNVWDLWGDDSGERMSKYSIYQAPCRYPWSIPCTAFEPDGSGDDGLRNASRNVDSVTLCQSCHVYANIHSTRLGGNLKKIDWTGAGDIHGVGTQPSCACDWGDKTVPYFSLISSPDCSLPPPPNQEWNTNYVLSCLDCHEPHGSPNEYLLRQIVNGVNVIDASHNNGPITGGKWWYFCTACHTNLNNCTGPCGGYGKHCSPRIGPTVPPYAENVCNTCHMHSTSLSNVCGTSCSSKLF